MLKKFFLFFILMLFKVAFAETVFVSAATSLRSFIKNISTSFRKKNPQCFIFFNTGPSGSLAIQIINGAPVDIFISASKYWADLVEKKGYCIKRKNFTKNKLVLVTYKDAKYDSLNDIFKAKKIAIGNYKFAPFGKYTYETLKNLHIFKKLKNKFIYANNVDQALAYVLSHNVDFAIVYYTDYLKEKNKLKLVYIFPDKLHKKINYYALLLRHAKGNTCAKSFYEYLFENQTQKLLEKYGFSK